jgi:Helix-turn-helix domain
MSEDLLFHISDVSCVRAWDDEGWGPVHRKLLTMCVAREHNGWKKRTGMTQTQLMLAHMLRTGSISQREAFLDYKVQAFTRRIADLRELGYKIVREYRKHPTTGQRYARYFINPSHRTAYATAA